MYLNGWKLSPSQTMKVIVLLRSYKKNIFSRFGTPRAIISDGGSHFCNRLFKGLLEKYGVRHNVVNPYHLKIVDKLRCQIGRLRRFFQKRLMLVERIGQEGLMMLFGTTGQHTRLP